MITITKGLRGLCCGLNREADCVLMCVTVGKSLLTADQENLGHFC